MKKFLAIALAAVMVLGLVACGETSSSSSDSSATKTIKAGFICLHDEQSTYDNNFINAAKEACDELGIEAVFKTGIDETEACLTAAEQLVEDEGCSFVFGDSFGHEAYILEAAKEFPDVTFAHATGTMAHTENVSNFSDAFASIYQGRYLAGVAAGMKLNQMIEEGKITADQAQMGYVGAFSYAEVISGFTSFYLGAKSVCPSVTMKVNYTNSWYDESAEYETATSLIKEGCVLISQHADSMGAPRACEENGVYNVSYNGSTESVGPTTYIANSRINWEPYFKYALTAVMNGEKLDTDWVGTLSTDSVEVSVNENNAAPGTEEKIEEVKEQLENGTLHVFDTSTFTVDGQTLTEYLADVDTDEAYTKDTQVISDGYFHESEYRSAPYFDIIIDGITSVVNN